jgi:hypothetical protein
LRAADTALEAAEVGFYHASTAHLSSYANDYFDYRAIKEVEDEYDRRVAERAEDSARWREFGIYSSESGSSYDSTNPAHYRPWNTP